MALDWKLLFHQLFALEIRKEFVLGAPEEEQEGIYTRLLNAFVHYSPRSFNELIEEAMQAESAEEARRIRLEFYEHPVSRALIHDFDPGRCFDRETGSIPEVKGFLDTLSEHQGRTISADENFFASPEGEAVTDALARGAEGKEQSVALVMVPGYAAHTIAHSIFEEIVTDANRFHGRPSLRPLLRADGLDLDFEDHHTFYARGTGEPPRLDILHPAGVELGNTTGHNAETTDLMAQWVESLPATYANTKLIFLGYSKGAPIVLDIVNRHPRLAPRILGYVTHAGVLQGAHAARFFLEQAEAILQDVSMETFVERLRAEDPTRLARTISPLFSKLDVGGSLPRVRAALETLGYDTTRYERQAERLLGGREVRELLDGTRDLSPLELVRWSLVHLSNESFPERTFLFNLSAVTDVADFVRPVDPVRGGEVTSSLLAPTFDESGAFDWQHFSLDALVLYFTSIAGFKNSPGGLFDTQVELAHSKTLHLDRRPLTASLRQGELDTLWRDAEVQAAVATSGVSDPGEFASRPRCELVAHDARSNVDAVDLGEFRGHHWSLFRQALRPPPEVSEKHAVWGFPRKAYMRALLQLLALRNLVDRAREAAQ